MTDLRHFGSPTFCTVEYVGLGDVWGSNYYSFAGHYRGTNLQVILGRLGWQGGSIKFIGQPVDYDGFGVLVGFGVSAGVASGVTVGAGAAD